MDAKLEEKVGANVGSKLGENYGTIKVDAIWRK